MSADISLARRIYDTAHITDKDVAMAIQQRTASETFIRAIGLARTLVADPEKRL